MLRFAVLAAAAAVFVAVSMADACSLCDPSATRQPMREEARQARVVLFGTLIDSKPGADGGTTDLQIEAVIKDDPAVAGKKVVTLPKYVPVDPKSPPKFIVFCDVSKEKLDPYRGFTVKSPAIVAYLKGGMALKADDPSAALKFFFDHLADAESEIANDAFLEFARANDRDVAKAAKQLDPARLRKLLEDPKTTDNKLSLFGYLLGSCGRPGDADYLAGLLRASGDRHTRATGGVLAGYIQLRPAEGWALARERIADLKRPFAERFPVLTAMRFFQASQGESARREILQTLAAALPQSDFADLIVEDLRRWQWWDMTADVLAQFGKKTHESPMMRRAIVRYALSCPKPEAKAFVANVRKADPELVKDVEEMLELERTPVSGGR